MKKREKLLALALTGSMLMSLTGYVGTIGAKASEEGEGAKLEWMNYDSSLPIVKEGYEKKLSVFCLQTPDFGAPEESWMYKYLTDQCNIDLEITPFTSDNASEVISLAFASGELPDIIIGGGFSTSNLLKYGMEEEQIIDIAPYITEEYMPNLSALYEAHPEFKVPVSDPEGHIWSLGYISNPESRANLWRGFINYDWMEELGYSAPATLDEFIDLMRAIKEAGYCEYPIGGSWAQENPSYYILNAMGYVGNTGAGFRVCLRDGEVVLPIYDREIFGEFLKIMNQIYEEGLIHPDFYTMDGSTTAAILSQGVGFISQAPLVYMADYTPYWGVTPLTSEWNDTPTWYTADSITFGGAVITSECEDPELACRLLDLFYNMDNEESGYRLAVHGPQSSQTDILYGLEGWEMIDGKFVYHDYEDRKDSYASSGIYLNNKVQLWATSIIGADPWHFNRAVYAYWGEADYMKEYSKEELPALRHTDEAIMASGDKCYGVGILSTTSEYVTTEVFPSAVYFETDIAERNTEIETALKEYATQEIAKFVTGSRPITEEELTNYFDTLEGLGAEEYLQNYSDYYSALKNN